MNTAGLTLTPNHPAALLSPWAQGCLCNMVGMWVYMGSSGLCLPGLRDHQCSGTPRRLPAALVFPLEQTKVRLRHHHSFVESAILSYQLISKRSVAHVFCPHKPGKKNTGKSRDHRKGSAETDGNSVAGRPRPVQIDTGAKCHQGLQQPGDSQCVPVWGGGRWHC